MSTQNTRISGAAKGDWKIMPHPDHKPGIVTTSKLTPEELQEYIAKLEPKKDYLKAKMEEKEMSKTTTKINITNEKLAAECKIHGVDSKASRIIAEKLGLTAKQVENLIMHRGIKKILTEEKADSDKKPETVSKIYEKYKKDHPEDDGSKEVVLRMSEGEPKAKDEAPVFVSFENGTYASIPVPIQMETHKRRKLRPKNLISQECIGIEYELTDEVLQVYENGTHLIDITWDDLENFIEDLLEIKFVISE